MNQAKKGLMNGTAVYFVGNVLVALIQLILMKFITGNIQPKGYGYYNLIVTVDNLITPVLTLQISDAVFRYVIRGDKSQKKAAFTNGIVVIIGGIIVTAGGVTIIGHLFYEIKYPVLVILYIVSTNIFVLYQKTARAVGANIEYVKSNLIKAVLYLILQMILISKFHMEVESLFIATITSTFVCLVVLEFRVKVRQYLDMRLFNSALLKRMLIFSIPLIPNTILWWLSGSVNSIIVTSRLGFDANGIYTVASKFANVLSMMTSVFNLAWQESAIKEYGSAESKKFYSETFRMYFNAILSCIIIIIPIMYLFMPQMIDIQYNDALKYAPILVIGTGVSALYGFFGQMYAATGRTKGAFTTTIYGVLVNLVVLFGSINVIGLYAPCIAMLISAIVITIVRYREFKEEMLLTLPKSVVSMALGLIIVLFNYYCGTFCINIFTMFVSIVFCFVINKNLIFDVLSMIKNKIWR